MISEHIGNKTFPMILNFLVKKRYFLNRNKDPTLLSWGSWKQGITEHSTLIHLLKSENEHLNEAYRHVSNENKYWQERYCTLEREFNKTEQQLHEIEQKWDKIADQIQSVCDCSIAIKDHLRTLFGSIERQIAIEISINQYFK